MRIARVEQVKVGNIMELSVSGHVLRWARQSKLSGGAWLKVAHGWNVKNQGHLTFARHMRERIKPILLGVTLREGEGRGICSICGAASKNLVDIIADQVQEQGAVVFLWHEESASWKGTSVKAATTCTS